MTSSSRATSKARARWQVTPDFTLSARADRLDVLSNGTLAIIDYKTGTPPSPREVRSLSPQLPLEALIARAGGFEGLEPMETSRIVYYRLAGRADKDERADRTESKDSTLAETLATTEQRLRDLIAYFAKPEAFYLSNKVPKPRRTYVGDYDHLARISEWIMTDQEDDDVGPSPSAPDLDRTRANQRKASHPGSSAWVIANAGAGKTHVLTQRVIRLLLSGVDPAAILCLTFTKVAAAEMSRRVFRDLGAWTSLDDAALGAAIAELEGAPPTVAQMRQARRLFAKALETPGGLKIQTIHAFCERLLHAFPFEANVPGQFQVMDQSATAAALAAAREEVMNRAASAPGSPLGEAVRRLAVGTADQQIGGALDALIAKRDDLRRWMENAAVRRRSGRHRRCARRSQNAPRPRGR